MMKLRSCIVLLVLHLLAGCATLHLVSFGISGISYLTTGKSVSDHAISAVVDQDCAVHRVIFAQTICRQVMPEDQPVPPVAKNPSTETSKYPQLLPANNIAGKKHHSLRSAIIAPGEMERYKVIGSFNNKSYAVTRANLYHHLGATIILNSEEKQTRYRVVLGPFASGATLPQISHIATAEKNSAWILSLCQRSRQPPPCNDGAESVKLAPLDF